MYNSKSYWTLFYLASSIAGCISISVFASLFGILTGINSSAIGLKICAIAAVIKLHKSIIEKNKKKHDKTGLLTKSKLYSIEVIISEALIDSNISHCEFFLINNGQKEYDDVKKKNQNALPRNILSESVLLLQSLKSP